MQFSLQTKTFTCFILQCVCVWVCDWVSLSLNVWGNRERGWWKEILFICKVSEKEQSVAICYWVYLLLPFSLAFVCVVVCVYVCVLVQGEINHNFCLLVAWCKFNFLFVFFLVFCVVNVSYSLQYLFSLYCTTNLLICFVCFFFHLLR